MKAELGRPPLVCALLAGLILMGLAGPSAAGPRRRHLAVPPPVLVELFTAQGCSTCQPADGVLADLAKRKDVLALTFSVDIWDFLGWPDTFAQPAFTARQRAYVRALKLRELSTPQVVVQGLGHAPGLDRDEVDGLIDDTTPPRAPVVRIAKGAKQVVVGAGPAPGRPADVWLVRYDPKPREVKVRAGENKGQTVMETHVVRDLVRLGPWRGAAHTYAIPQQAAATPPETLKAAVLVQAPRGGKVLGVGRE